MSRRFIELAIRARRLVPGTATQQASGRPRVTARRQLGGELTQFSFRLALIIDLAYVGLGALGGAALGRAAGPSLPPAGCRPAAPFAPPNDSAAVPGGPWESLFPVPGSPLPPYRLH